MRIIVDAMGGDNAPEALVFGALKAKKELGVDITLVGRREDIEKCLSDAGHSGEVSIVDARDLITMDDDPSTAVRHKKDSSMSVALNLLREGEGDAMVSAGSTGALLAGATLVLKRIKGIRRAALAPVVPNADKGFLLIDCGANVDCLPEYLLQFAFMGGFYANKIMGCENPRIALLNNGTEEHKGGELQKSAYALLKQASDEGKINFVGNIESSEVLFKHADVVVSDGYSGNILLKSLEGTARFLMSMFKEVLSRSLKNKLAALAIKNDMRDLKGILDVNNVGGTALVGIQKPVIKAHGSSGELAVFSAIRQAVDYTRSGMIEETEKNIEYMKLPATGNKISEG